MTIGKNLVQKLKSGLATTLLFISPLSSFDYQEDVKDFHKNELSYNYITEKIQEKSKNKIPDLIKQNTKKGLENKLEIKENNPQNLIHHEKLLEKSEDQKLLAYKFLDILNQNEPWVNDWNGLSIIKKESLEKTVENFKTYYKNLPKKAYSEFTEEEVKEVFLKIEKSVPSVKGEDRSRSCLLRALIYHSIGETYGFPIHLVLTPPSGNFYHIFSRWDPDGKHDALNPDNPVNKGDFNWDNNTSRDNSYGINRISDNYFIDHWFIPEETIKNKIYLKNLNPKEILAIAYFLSANSSLRGIWVFQPTSEAEAKLQEVERKKLLKKSLEFSNKALELDSLCVPAYNTKAIALGGNWNISYNKFDKALEILNKAIKLNPNQENLIFTLGDVYYSRNFFNDKKKGLFPLNEEWKIKERNDQDMKTYFEIYKKAIEIGEDKINKEIRKEFPNYSVAIDIQKEIYSAYSDLELSYFFLDQKEEEKKMEEEIVVQGLVLNYLKTKDIDQLKEIKDGKFKR